MARSGPVAVSSDEVKARAVAAVEERSQELIELSLSIHRNPELGFQEEKASAALAEYLATHGFRVERGICGLSTAFRAEAGGGQPRVALVAEYDALPGLGHACGHNIIGTASVGAAVAAKEALDQLNGTIVVLGTPAEEIYGGKVIMANRGAFQGLDCALMVHPGSREAAVTHSLACAEITVEYFGRAAHAAAHPEAGINALDALILAYNAISALRQHIRSSSRIHGVITDGGRAPNVVPDHAAASFLVRAEDDDYLEEVKERVLACFRAGAEATGARLECRWGEVQYAALRINRPLAEAYRQNMEALGRQFVDRAQGWRGFGSTDMGNVSRLLPAIHPTVSIAPPDASIHTPEFALLAASEAGHRGLLDAAKALAMTALDVLLDPELRQRMRKEFEAE